ncbi:hypothetical protein MACH09_46890 [Vibrio sp. MACH09]|uniref:conjugal transfer protein TraF n=1 Tax=Vibrio sp. MACH09 TaxID=3025122 RepID=UPI002791FA3E|nr:conjugal transfer protein TraF [Vibrio sp. MACH09]GLO64181.1 hypothetical protein MACH09_46890 [Vibrio sp. MACH09]
MRLLSIMLVWLSVSLTPSHAAMSNEYAIVFLFQNSCGYCHRFAPQVTKASQSLGIPVYAFSLDGEGIPDFPVPFPATQETRDTFLVDSKVVPATFLINVNSRKFTRITTGYFEPPILYQGLSSAINDPEVQEALR